MVFLDVVLPSLLYIVAIVLIVVLIFVALRLLKILDKVDKVVDNVEEKINTFDSALAVMKRTADGLANISDSFIFGISSTISKVFRKFKKEDKYNE